MKGRLVQLDFSAEFDKISHCSLFYKLRFMDFGGRFLSIVAEFLSDRRRRVRWNGKVSVSDNVASGMHQGSVLGPLLYILYISKLFHFVGNYIGGDADDTSIYTVISRPLLRPQVTESLNQDLAVINSGV